MAGPRKQTERENTSDDGFSAVPRIIHYNLSSNDVGENFDRLVQVHSGGENGNEGRSQY